MRIVWSPHGEVVGIKNSMKNEELAHQQISTSAHQQISTLFGESHACMGDLFGLIGCGFGIGIDGFLYVA